MLFITKGAVRREVTKAVQPLIRMADMRMGLPPSYWDDEQILGFLTGTISGLIHVVGKQKYRGTDSGEVMVGVFEDLLGRSRGLEVSRATASLMLDPIFAEAMKAGFLSVMVAMHGPEPVNDEPIVKRAKQHAKTMADMSFMTGPQTQAALISSAIQDFAYVQRVLELREHERD